MSAVYRLVWFAAHPVVGPTWVVGAMLGVHNRWRFVEAPLRPCPCCLHGPQNELRLGTVLASLRSGISEIPSIARDVRVDGAVLLENVSDPETWLRKYLGGGT